MDGREGGKEGRRKRAVEERDDERRRPFGSGSICGRSLRYDYRLPQSRLATSLLVRD